MPIGNAFVAPRAAAPSLARSTTEDVEAEAPPAAPASDDSPLTTIPSRTRKPRKPASLNGWVPDYEAFCYGLPGSLAPLGDFDPLGFSQGKSLEQMTSYREAELKHGRIAMAATLGWIAQPVRERAWPPPTSVCSPSMLRHLLSEPSVPRPRRLTHFSSSSTSYHLLLRYRWTPGLMLIDAWRCMGWLALYGAA